MKVGNEMGDNDELIKVNNNDFKLERVEEFGGDEKLKYRKGSSRIKSRVVPPSGSTGGVGDFGGSGGTRGGFKGKTRGISRK